MEQCVLHADDRACKRPGFLQFPQLGDGVRPFHIERAGTRAQQKLKVCRDAERHADIMAERADIRAL